MKRMGNEYQIKWNIKVKKQRIKEKRKEKSKNRNAKDIQIYYMINELIQSKGEVKKEGIKTLNSIITQLKPKSNPKN